MGGSTSQWNEGNQEEDNDKKKKKRYRHKVSLTVWKDKITLFHI